MWPWSKIKRENEDDFLVVAGSLQEENKQQLELVAGALGIQVRSGVAPAGPYILVIEGKAPPPPDLGEEVFLIRLSDGELERHLREALLYVRAAKEFKK